MHSSIIKQFVQQTLGCSCPQEVFDQIDYQKAGAGNFGGKINVGGRLLVYIISMDEKSGLREVINAALQQGVRERDEKGFNRFRLVLAASRPDELSSLAEQVFARSGEADGKAYLHVVSEAEVRGFDSSQR